MSALVSVVIPTYKRCQYICETIESVLTQTYNNIEIIVVDDNGLDTEWQKETYNRLKSFIDNKQINYIPHKTNMNGATARNTGINNANGKYIAFLDDDDLFLPSKIKKQVCLLDNSDSSYGACYTGHIRVFCEEKQIVYSDVLQGNHIEAILLNKVDMCSGSTLMVKKDILNKTGVFDTSLKRHQDFQFSLAIAMEYNIAAINEALTIIRLTQKEYYIRSGKSIEEIKKSFMRSISDSFEKLTLDFQQKVILHQYTEICKSYILEYDFKNVIRLLNETDKPVRAFIILVGKCMKYFLRKL